MSAAPPAPRVLLVDDDDDLRAAHLQTLALAGVPALGFPAAEPALARIDADFAGVVVTDVRMPGLDGLALAERIRAIDPDLPVILMTGHGDIQMAVDALTDGAFDFLVKPFAADRLLASLGRAQRQRDLVMENRRLSALVAQGGAEGDQTGLLGQSPAIERVRAVIRAVAHGDVDVLIEGETGAGKEVAARGVHRLSPRARRPFVVINCAALSEAAFETELLGRPPSGSGQGRRIGGRVREASGGALLVDEIDALSPPMQARLFRLIEDRELTQEGAAGEPVDLRVLATSRADLGAAVGEGRFRADLYYRLGAVRLRLPPLRERGEDVELLFRHFLAASAARQRIAPPPVTAEVLAHLAQHDWPGNVRELSQYAERHALGLGSSLSDRDAEAEPPLAERVAAFEARAIGQALAATGGDVARALVRLGLARKTFYDKVKRHGLDLGAYRARE